MSLTHWKKLTNPDYLGAWALEPGQELIVTIKLVRREMVTGADGKKEECTVVHFAEKDIKPMILNATNAKMITGLLKTPHIEKWPGHKIQIYSTEVKAFGDVVEALRIRPMLPKTTREELTPQSPRWAGAVESLRAGTITIEEIKKRMDISDKNAALLCNGAKTETEADTCQEQDI